MANRMLNFITTVLAILSLAGCAKSASTTPTTTEAASGSSNTAASASPFPTTPPASAEPSNFDLPEPARATLSNGLDVVAVELNSLPVVYAVVALRSGSAADPKGAPGTASMVAQLLREGTRERSAAELAEAIDFLGADLWAAASDDGSVVGIRMLADQLDEGLELLAEVVTSPAFAPDEVNKLKRRELDRLALAENEPRPLVRREFFGRLYGKHPYANVDTTPQVVRNITQAKLNRWYQTHYVAKNASLFVVGSVAPRAVQVAAKKHFGEWRSGKAASVRYPTPPKRTGRSIVVVDRPGSVQSLIYIGHLAMKRNNDDWIELSVANQVLGGSAASRLFMDLRERRSLTYGAYSNVSARKDVGPFAALASVRTEVTIEALDAFFEHLERITTEAPSAEEVTNAKRYLSDSFPLQVDTPGSIANLLIDVQTYDLDSDYWDTYRRDINEVSNEEAFEAAKQYIRPDKALVVIVGQAASFAEKLAKFGPVTVVGTDGTVKATFKSTKSTKATQSQ